jgi:hypothetical protein
MSAGALAQPFEAPLTDDAGINGNNPTLKLGASDSLVVDNYGPKHGLFKFDTSALTGRSITRATFKFFVRTANTSAPRRRRECPEEFVHRRTAPPKQSARLRFAQAGRD